jgi:FIMAH domain-containing protein
VYIDNQGGNVKLARLFAVLVATLSMSAALAGSASATTVEKCQAELADLQTATEAAGPSFTNQKDVNGLLGKLDAASTKLVQGKNVDAVQKLVEFQTTLNALATAPKPKIDPTVAQALSTDAQTVIDCIDAIGTT